MRTYRLPQGARVTLTGDRRLLEEAARYLGAHADEEPGGIGGWTVEILRRSPPILEAARPWESFGERFTIVPAGDGALLLRHDGTPTQVWRPEALRVGVVVDSMSGRHAVTQSMYAAVRRIGLLAASDGGMAVLHAAAVDAGQGAILICGAKGAGKTTLALALLARGAAYLASDRTVVCQGTDGAWATGWMGTFRLDPAAVALALDGPLAEAVARHLHRRRAANAHWWAGKFRFPPRDLLALLGASSRPKSRPRLLIEVSPAAEALEPVWMSRGELEAAWRRHGVAGEPFPAETGRPRPPLGAPRALRGVRLGRSTPQAMARRVLALATS